MRAKELLLLGIAVLGDLQLMHIASTGPRVGGLKRFQLLLTHPLEEDFVGGAELLCTALNVWFQRPEVLVAFPPLLDVARLKKSQLLEQFERPDSSLALQHGFRRLNDTFSQSARPSVATV